MGAWGSGPYDNDTAADWFFELKEIGLYDLIERGLNSDSYEEQRAAAWLVQRLAITAYVYDVNLIDEHRKLAVEKLQSILNNKGWLETWVDSDETITELKQQIHEIENPESSPGLMEKICGLGVPDEGTPDETMMDVLNKSMEESGFTVRKPGQINEEKDC